MPELEQEPQPRRVSVVIVVRDCVPQLRRSLAALESSPGRDEFEVLVVDNGSHDGSQSIDKEFPGVTMLRLPHHCGLTKARNIAIRTAKTEFVLLLHPSVELDAGAVLKLADRLERDPAALAVCPVLRDAGGKIVTRVRRLPSAGEVKAVWRDPNGLPVVNFDPATPPEATELHDGLALLVRKRSIQTINYLDEKFGEYWGDVELAYHFRRAGKRIVLAADIGGQVSAAGDPIRSADAGIRASFAADAAHGASVYLSKHHGGASGYLFLIGLVLVTFLSALTMRDAGYAWGLLSRLVGGYKIDGTSQQF